MRTSARQPIESVGLDLESNPGRFADRYRRVPATTGVLSKILVKNGGSVETGTALGAIDQF
ncbi:hypothetical protein [Bradyrhizobium sp.]|jgi:hypothetical protein|uniref:hypothetical protein n=1 Tax=Bradyrhizobium sp. TaxID=376 RepID=UPI003BB14A86